MVGGFWVQAHWLLFPSSTHTQACQRSKPWLKHACPGLVCLIIPYSRQLFSATHASEMSVVERLAS